MASSPFAAADIFLCTDAQGRRELTDANRPGCKMLDVPGSIPAPPARKGPAPQQQPQQARITSTLSTATPAAFPRVDTAQQRARDDDRRGILSEELRSEERRLADLRVEFNNGEPERQGNEKNYAKYQARVADMRDSISRSEKNVEALKRELSNIR